MIIITITVTIIIIKSSSSSSSHHHCHHKKSRSKKNHIVEKKNEKEWTGTGVWEEGKSEHKRRLERIFKNLNGLGHTHTHTHTCIYTHIHTHTYTHVHLESRHNHFIDPKVKPGTYYKWEIPACSWWREISKFSFVQHEFKFQIT